MAEHIKIRPAKGKWVVRAGGAVLGESTEALELTEDGYQPVIYFPRRDLAMAFLEKTNKTSNCPWKGDATYFSIHTKSTVLENAAWSYESPVPGAEPIAEYIAFYADRVAVEKL